MTVIYRCDHCNKDFDKIEIIRLVAYPKNRMSTRKGDCSIGSVDVCKHCYEELFK